MSPRRDGFTLIEMLVALAVFALAAMALMKLTIESTRTAAMLEQRTVAGMIADTVAAELALGRQTASAGQMQMAGQSWTWIAGEVAVEGQVRGLEVRVMDGTQMLAQRRVHRSDAPQ